MSIPIKQFDRPASPVPVCFAAPPSARAIRTAVAVADTARAKAETGEAAGRERLGEIWMRPDTITAIAEAILIEAAIGCGVVDAADFTAHGFTPAQARIYGRAAWRRLVEARPDIAARLGSFANPDAALDVTPGRIRTEDDEPDEAAP